MSDHKSKRKHEEEEEEEPSNKKQKTPITERNYHSRMFEVIETATEFKLLPELVNMINEYFKSFVVEVAESDKAYAVGRYLRMTLDSPTDKVPSKCEWFDHSPDEPHTTVDVSKGMESCGAEDYVKHLELSDTVYTPGQRTMTSQSGMKIHLSYIDNWLNNMPIHPKVHFVYYQRCDCGNQYCKEIAGIQMIRYKTTGGGPITTCGDLFSQWRWGSVNFQPLTPYNIPKRIARLGCSPELMRVYKPDFSFEKGHHYFSVTFAHILVSH